MEKFQIYTSEMPVIDEYIINRGIPKVARIKNNTEYGTFYDIWDYSYCKPMIITRVFFRRQTGKYEFVNPKTQVCEYVDSIENVLEMLK